MKLKNGSKMIERYRINETTCGVVCLYLGNYVTWLAELDKDSGLWSCFSGNYFGKDFSAALKGFRSRFVG